MSDPAAPGPLDGLSEDVTADGVFGAVLEGYDAVYDALPRGETFNRLWRLNAYDGGFPEQFAHIGFLTAPEAQRLRELLQIRPGETLADLACGAGGPGLWMARESGASLIGIDPSAAGLAAARQRARDAGLASRARFQHGTFEHTNLADGAAGAVMSIDAFQYAPDKRTAFAEFARIMRAGARAGIVCFEVDPATVAGLPVLGVDPVPDYESVRFFVRGSFHHPVPDAYPEPSSRTIWNSIARFILRFPGTRHTLPRLGGYCVFVFPWRFRDIRCLILRGSRGGFPVCH